MEDVEKTTKSTKQQTPGQERIIKKKAEFILMFENNGFNISITCEKIGIDRGTYYNWLEDNAFKLAIEYQREAILDFAESKLLHFMNKSKDERLQFNAVQFFLKTKGKVRDYTEKSEVAHSGDMNIQYISHIPKEDEKPEDMLESQDETVVVEIDDLMQEVVI